MIAKDRNIKLSIEGIDLETNDKVLILLRASNPFMLVPEYLKASNETIIESWEIDTTVGIGGNTGINAGAYLFREMQEITGMNLA